MKQKARISAEDIMHALNEALRRRQQCATMSVERIFETNSGPANWDAAISCPEGGIIDPECKRMMLTIKLGLQNRFDLALNS
jgi:hypothetical protein